MVINGKNIEAWIYYKKCLIDIINQELKDNYINVEIPKKDIELGKNIHIPGKTVNRLSDQNEKEPDYINVTIIKISDRRKEENR